MSAFATGWRTRRAAVNSGAVLFPDPEKYRQELVFFARLFADLTRPIPTTMPSGRFTGIASTAFTTACPTTSDPRPRGNTERFVRHFMGWTLTGALLTVVELEVYCSGHDCRLAEVGEMPEWPLIE